MDESEGYLVWFDHQKKELDHKRELYRDSFKASRRLVGFVAIFFFVGILILVNVDPSARTLTYQINSSASITNTVASPPAAPWLRPLIPLSVFSLVLGDGLFFLAVALYPFRQKNPDLTPEDYDFYYAYTIYKYLQFYKKDPSKRKADQDKALAATDKLANRFVPVRPYTRTLTKKEIGKPLELLRKNIRNHLYFSIKKGDLKVLDQASFVVKSIGEFLINPDPSLGMVVNLNVLLEGLPGEERKERKISVSVFKLAQILSTSRYLKAFGACIVAALLVGLLLTFEGATRLVATEYALGVLSPLLTVVTGFFLYGRSKAEPSKKEEPK
jgi:hypothetical protein